MQDSSSALTTDMRPVCVNSIKHWSGYCNVCILWNKTGSRVGLLTGLIFEISGFILIEQNASDSGNELCGMGPRLVELH